MQRLIASFMAFLMVVTMSVPAFAQASRYRLNTQVGTQDGPAPSFRGSERQGWDVPVPDAGSAGDALQLPRSMPRGDGMDSGLGGAAMMGMGYHVHVLGEVMRPGTYRITASDRLSEVLRRAGGLAPNGSERKIELKRKGGATKIIDLLAFQLFGRLDNNPYLTDNDVVFVPLRDKVIQVVGAVRRPDFYELKNERDLAAVVELAGGFNAATAHKEPIRVIRFVEGEKTVEEVVIEKGEMKRFAIHAGDVIVVPNVVTKETEFDYNVASIPGDQVFYPSYEDRVFVLGGVAMPGAYPFSPYYTVNQYISLAGGLNDRGKEKYRIINIAGKSRQARETDRVNPGDTVMIKQRWMSPAGWLGFALSVASFGLSASATIIAISK